MLPDSIYDLHIGLLKEMRCILAECFYSDLKVLSMCQMMHDLTEHETCLREINFICERDLGFSLLTAATSANDIVMCRKLIEVDVDVNYRGLMFTGWSVKTDVKGTALHVAALRGYLALVKLLVDNGADTDLATNKTGWRYLDDKKAYDLARHGGHQDVSKYLESKGVRVNIDAEDSGIPTTQATLQTMDGGLVRHSHYSV